MFSSPLPLHNRRLLLIEDEVDTRNLLRFILEMAGAEVMAVDSVYKALEALERNRPDAIVCNIYLPDGDGYSLLSAWRQQEQALGHPTIPAIIVTESERDVEKQKLREAGFQSFITRPFAVERVAQDIADVIEPYLE